MDDPTFATAGEARDISGDFNSLADWWSWAWPHLAPYLPPAWVWQTLATLTAVAALALAWRTVRRGWRALAARAKANSFEDNLTIVGAAIASGVSATGMWQFAGDVLNLWWPLRIVLFAFIEIAIITSAVRARRNMRENFSAGIDGIAVWALTALTAVLSSMDARSLPEAVFRLAAPLVAAWLWERGMAIERHRIRGTGRINWRLTPERLLVRMGLAEVSGRTTSEVDVQRRITRLALAAKRAREFRDSGASDRKQRAALARLDRVFEQAAERVGLGRDEQLQKRVRGEVAALYSVNSLMDIEAASAWDPTSAQVAEPHVCSAEVVKVPVTIRRVVERPVQIEVERRVEVPVPVPVEKLIEVPVVAVDAVDAARIAYEHSLTGPGRPIGQRALARRFGIEVRTAEEIIKSSQRTADGQPVETPETAPDATGQESAEEAAQDRHSTPAEEGAATPGDALAAWLLGTAVTGHQEVADSRHRSVPPVDGDPSAAGVESAPPPAPVTIDAADDPPVSDRHSISFEEPTEGDRGSLAEVPPVTLSEETDETPAALSRRIPFMPLTPVFREPPAGQSVTTPEAVTRPSRDNGLNAFDRAIEAAIEERHRLPVLNGAGPTDTAPTGGTP